MRECDLHGLKFEVGREKLIRLFNSCIMSKERNVQIIHGYHGDVYKNYIHSDKFIKEMEDEGIYIESVSITANPGVTNIVLDVYT